MNKTAVDGTPMDDTLANDTAMDNSVVVDDTADGQMRSTRNQLCSR